MHHDPISDLLTRIRNANMANLTRLAVPSSKIKLEIVRILKEEGFISDYSKSDKYHGIIKIFLKNDGSNKVLTNLERISKPSKRVYEAFNSIPKTLDGYGVTIVSTSKGLMTDKQARKNKIGGEIICKVW
jgi:small subunit ribosomal protein S8